MIAVYIAMFFILLVAAVIAGVVVVGMEGVGGDKIPDAARRRFGDVARQMNGDAEPPQAFLDMYAHATGRS